MMKAITYDHQNDLFELRTIREAEFETEFDVKIQVDCVGLNPVDAKVNSWFDSMVIAGERDFVGGLDVSGTIVSKGSQVHGWEIGDKVLYHGNMRRRQGGFAKFAIHDARTLTKHPNISSAEAAASPCAAWTAYRALIDKLHIKKHGSILIYGATGGVGSYALQLCRHFQLSTIIAVCSEENFSYANGLGATHCFDYRDPMFFEKIKGFVGENGVDYALDCVGGSAQVICSSLLGFDGQLAELVSTIETSAHQNIFGRALSFHQVSLGSGHIYGPNGVHSITNAGNAINQLLEIGAIQPPKITTIDIGDIPNILYNIRNSHTQGKFVAKIN